MKPLIVLISIFLIGILIKGITRSKNITTAQIGRIAISSMLVFTGIAHFVFIEGMSAMLPEELPIKKSIVIATGILEILGALGLLMPKYMKATAMGLMLFLTMVFPANIYAAIHHIDPVSGLQDGPGPEYLLFRAPLQILFIGWIYLSAIKTKTNNKQ